MKVTCSICNHHKDIQQVIPSEMLSQAIHSTITATYPNWKETGHFICLKDLKDIQATFIQNSVNTAHNNYHKTHHNSHTKITKEQPETFGEKVSDKLAEFGGSWAFIGLFVLSMVSWIILNSIALLAKPFDPYPFILLNLLLSCLAAIQAPIIMMSQNRQEKKDRLRAENDYLVNVKAELEIRQLHEKLDILMANQWKETEFMSK